MYMWRVLYNVCKCNLGVCQLSYMYTVVQYMYMHMSVYV